MRKVVLLLSLVSLAACLAASTWAAGLFVQVLPDRDTSNELTGNMAARVRVVGLTSAREVVFHLSFPTVYAVDTAASDIRIVAVKPGADVMSIDANNPPTPSNPADDTPVVFAEGTTSTVREVWVVALLTATAQTPKVVCDVVFTALGRPTTANVAIDNVQVKDGALSMLASTATFSSSADGTAPGVSCPVYGDFNWNGLIDPSDLSLMAGAWEMMRANKYAAFADIAPSDGASTIAARVSISNSSVNPADLSAQAWAWENK